MDVLPGRGPSVALSHVSLLPESIVPGYTPLSLSQNPSYQVAPSSSASARDYSWPTTEAVAVCIEESGVRTNRINRACYLVHCTRRGRIAACGVRAPNSRTARQLSGSLGGPLPLRLPHSTYLPWCQGGVPVTSICPHYTFFGPPDFPLPCGVYLPHVTPDTWTPDTPDTATPGGRRRYGCRKAGCTV
jgi:hypothetical protein